MGLTALTWLRAWVFDGEPINALRGMTDNAVDFRFAACHTCLPAILHFGVACYSLQVLAGGACQHTNHSRAHPWGKLRIGGEAPVGGCRWKRTSSCFRNLSHCRDSTPALFESCQQSRDTVLGVFANKQTNPTQTESKLMKSACFYSCANLHPFTNHRERKDVLGCVLEFVKK